MRLTTKQADKVVAALQTAFNGPHEYTCDYRWHIRRAVERIPMNHTRRWKAARAEALKTAPPCSCGVRQAEEALRAIGVEPKVEE